MSRRRAAQLEPSSAVLQRAIAGLGGDGDGQAALILRVFQEWPAVVGERFAQRAQPVALGDGVLLVEAQTTAWQNEITYLRATIARRLNAQLGCEVVRQVRVRSGRPPPRQPPRAPAPGPIDADDIAWAQAYSTPILDPEVRAAFEGMLARHARRRRPGASEA